jgi:hypothetical protein
LPEPAQQIETAADPGTTPGPTENVAATPRESGSLGLATSTPDISLSGEEIPDPEQAEDKNIGINADDTSEIHEFLPSLNDILRSGTSEVNWKRFQETLTNITEKVKALLGLLANISLISTEDSTTYAIIPKGILRHYLRFLMYLLFERFSDQDDETWQLYHQSREEQTHWWFDSQQPTTSSARKTAAMRPSRRAVGRRPGGPWNDTWRGTTTSGSAPWRTYAVSATQL